MILERRRCHGVTAFNFVQQQFTLAAKPLGFGLQQAQCGVPRRFNIENKGD